jgi:hypothetical protein
MSKKHLPKQKKVNTDTKVTNTDDEKIFQLDTDLDMKIAMERRKQGLPEQGFKHPDRFNEDKSMDRNVL